jgi:hypothetical protein
MYNVHLSTRIKTVFNDTSTIQYAHFPLKSTHERIQESGTINVHGEFFLFSFTEYVLWHLQPQREHQNCESYKQLVGHFGWGISTTQDIYRRRTTQTLKETHTHIHVAGGITTHDPCLRTLPTIGTVVARVIATGRSSVSINQPFTAQRSPYVPPGLTLNNSTFCPHSVFMCFVWISEQTAIISLYSIN